MLLSDLQDTANSNIFFPISTALVFCLKSLVPQCWTIHSGLFDIVGCMYDFMSSVVAALNCFVTNLLFSSGNSHLLPLSLLSPLKLPLLGVFLVLFSINRLISVSFSGWMFLILIFVRMYCFTWWLLWCVNLHCYFDCPH